MVYATDSSGPAVLVVLLFLCGFVFFAVGRFVFGLAFVVVLGIKHTSTSWLLWRRGRVFVSHAEGRRFDPHPGQKVIRIFSPVTSGAQRK